MKSTVVQAEIVTIGDELLIGQTIDSNSAFIGAELIKKGIPVQQITSIPDERDRILRALDEAASRADLILMTGGLGPTTDDITKATLAEYFGTELEIVPEVLAEIEAFFQSINREMLDVNRQQAALPKSCYVVRNRRGTASGMWFEKDGKVFVSMPGVPYEMEGLMRDEILDRIGAYFNTPFIIHRTVMTQGIGESYIAEQVSLWAAGLDAKGIKIAYLPAAGQVRIRLSATGEKEADTVALVEAEREALVAQIGEYVYGYDDAKIWEVVGKSLGEQGMTVGTAESCTGGYIAHLLTSVAGSSDYFQGSVVAYSNEVKATVLDVDRDALESFGAVSKQVVEQMAEGVRAKLGTDFGLATSGIAGPSGGSDEKPVGTVWIAVAGPGGVESVKKQFGKHRGRNIERAALSALDMLLRKIPVGEFEKH